MVTTSCIPITPCIKQTNKTSLTKNEFKFDDRGGNLSIYSENYTLKKHEFTNKILIILAFKHSRPHV